MLLSPPNLVGTDIFLFSKKIYVTETFPKLSDEPLRLIGKTYNK